MFLQIKKAIVLKKLEQLVTDRITIHDATSNTLKTFGDSNSDKEGILVITDDRFYSAVLSGGTIGAAEAFMAGYWSSKDLVTVMQILIRNVDVLDGFEHTMSPLRRLKNQLQHKSNKNTVTGSKRNILAHYDIGNDFYSALLGPSMMYSSGKSNHPIENLEDGQDEKLGKVIRMIRNNVGMRGAADPSIFEGKLRILEIGSGWGTMAIKLATELDAQVTTITISDEQAKYVRERVKLLGLEDSVTVMTVDYRDLPKYFNGSVFDAVVSIEMIEAVGKEFLSGYYDICSKMLMRGGLLAIQAITLAEHRESHYSAKSDFIQQYIFPGGYLPTFSGLISELSNGRELSPVETHSFPDSYADTLMLWDKNIDSMYHATADRYNIEREFWLLWKFYFAYCAAGFRERSISVSQLYFRKD